MDLPMESPRSIDVGIKLEIKSEIDVIEIGEEIFQQEAIAPIVNDSSKLEYHFTDKDESDNNELAVFSDEIVKEEPVYFDSITANVYAVSPKLSPSEKPNEVMKKRKIEPNSISNLPVNGVNTKKRLYECYICDQPMSKISALKSHFLSHIGRIPFKCHLCPATFHRKCHLTRHSNKHYVGENIKPPVYMRKSIHCSLCSAKFTSKSSRNRHLRSHVNGTFKKRTIESSLSSVQQKEAAYFTSVESFVIKTYECYLCTFRGHRANLKLHMKTQHTAAQLFECDICSKKFVLKGSINSHIKTHSTEPQFKCDVCDQRFFRNECLKIHMQKIHTKNFPFSCRFCSKQFSKRYSFVTHIRTHTNFKPYQCDFCPKNFVKKSDMVRHARTHTGERPFQCNICQMTFTRNHTLSDHKRNIHRLL